MDQHWWADEGHSGAARAVLPEGREERPQELVLMPNPVGGLGTHQEFLEDEVFAPDFDFGDRQLAAFHSLWSHAQDGPAPAVSSASPQNGFTMGEEESICFGMVCYADLKNVIFVLTSLLDFGYKMSVAEYSVDFWQQCIRC